ncbi:MAG: glycosyltransferase family 4 protein [Deltaproteobacteria bacterium]
MTTQRGAAILLPSLSEGDATGTDALRMRAALEGAGWRVRIFATDRSPGAEAEDLDAARRFLRREKPLVIYHQGTRWDAGLALLGRARGPVLVRDHNVTPAEFFRNINEDFVRTLEVGAQARRTLAGNKAVARFLPCSEFSATELRDMGVANERIRVCAPFHDLDAIVAAGPDAGALRSWTRDPADLLFVGRIAPNKGHRRMLRVAAIYRELFGRRLRIRLAGKRDPRLAVWEAILHRDAARFGVSLDITGGLTAAELKAAWLTSRILLCCSEHEGFCVPLVEAVHLGLPIIATPFAAVPETLGSGGIVSDDDDELATAIHRLLESGALRDEVVAAQRIAISDRFSADMLARRFLEIVDEAVAETAR